MLSANTPAFGSGMWSMVSSTGGSFGSNTDPNTTFTGVAGSAYTLRWTVNNGSCSAMDDVAVSFNVDASMADAGADQDVCGTTVVTTTAGNTLASLETGLWTLTTGSGTIY